MDTYEVELLYCVRQMSPLFACNSDGWAAAEGCEQAEGLVLLAV